MGGGGDKGPGKESGSKKKMLRVKEIEKIYFFSLRNCIICMAAIEKTKK